MIRDSVTVKYFLGMDVFWMCAPHLMVIEVYFQDQRIRHRGALNISNKEKAFIPENKCLSGSCCEQCQQLHLKWLVLWHRFGKEVCDAIAAKCLTGRTKTLDKSLEAFLLWVELEAVEAFMVCEALVPPKKNQTKNKILSINLACTRLSSVFRGKNIIIQGVTLGGIQTIQKCIFEEEKLP